MAVLGLQAEREGHEELQAEHEREVERLRAEHDDLRERLEAAEQNVGRAEARADDLRRQLREANAKNDDVEECVTYVQDERSAERRRREAGILTRTKWWLVGQPSNDEE